jgi:hypothetical protein
VWGAGACAAPFCQLPAVALLAGELAAGPVAVRMPLVALVAVAVPAGQPLERGPGRLPVAAAAGTRPARLGAQQPLGIDLVPPATPDLWGNLRLGGGVQLVGSFGVPRVSLQREGMGR